MGARSTLTSAWSKLALEDAAGRSPAGAGGTLGTVGASSRLAQGHPWGTFATRALAHASAIGPQQQLPAVALAPAAASACTHAIPAGASASENTTSKTTRRIRIMRKRYDHPSNLSNSYPAKS